MRETTNVKTKSVNVNKIVQIAMLGALATVLMLVEVPIPFLAPPFYKLDLSEVPVLIGAFAMGPLAGSIIELIKILLNFVLNGTATAGVGEIGNFLLGCAFVMPAGFLYRHKKTKKSAVQGMIAGVMIMTIFGAMLNGWVLLPTYAKAFGMSLTDIVALGSEIFPWIKDTFTFCLFCVVPFNVVKGIVVSIVTFLLYKRISIILKQHQ